MIVLTRLDGKEIVVGGDHILYVESTPDTVLTLTTGTHLMVKESVEEVVNRVVAFRHRILVGGPAVGPPESGAGAAADTAVT